MNKTFKAAIEKHYIGTLLQGTVLRVDFETNFSRHSPHSLMMQWGPQLRASFRFDGFADKEQRLALMRPSEPLTVHGMPETREIPEAGKHEAREVKEPGCSAVPAIAIVS